MTHTMLNNSASRSYTATSIPVPLPAKPMHGASLTEADRENMRSRNETTPSLQWYRRQFTRAPSITPRQRIHMVALHSIYSPNNSRVNLSSHSEFAYCQCFMHTTDKPDYVEARLFMRQRWTTNAKRQTNTKRQILKQNHGSFLETTDISVWLDG